MDQGYAFKVITRLEGLENFDQLAFATPQERRELLMDVLLARDEDAKRGEDRGRRIRHEVCFWPGQEEEVRR